MQCKKPFLTHRAYTAAGQNSDRLFCAGGFAYAQYLWSGTSPLQARHHGPLHLLKGNSLRELHSLQSSPQRVPVVQPGLSDVQATLLHQVLGWNRVQLEILSQFKQPSVFTSRFEFLPVHLPPEKHHHQGRLLQTSH